MKAQEIEGIVLALTPAIKKYVQDQVASVRQEIPKVDIAQIAAVAAEKMPAPKDGVDGKDGQGIEISQVREMVEAAVATELAKLEPPRDGKDGVDGADGKPGEQGPPGASISREEVQEMVEASVSAIEVVVPEAEPGRDALQIEILPTIDASQSYSRGTYATYRGGLWRSFEQTSGMRGWEPIVNGVAETRIERADERTFRLYVAHSNGTELTQDYRMPFGIYRGYYKEGETYLVGDFVSRGGSVWCARADNPQTAPGMGNRDDWELTVKRGRDGKPA